MSYEYGKTIPSRNAIEEMDAMRRAIHRLRAANETAAAEKQTLERKLAAARHRATALRERPRKLPASVHGGSHGLLRAAKESADLDKRTVEMIAAGHDSEWIREFKRIRNIK